MRTRAQEDLIKAEALVRGVLREDEGLRKTYGRLCHTFPILVLTSGLCQALAFSKAKAEDEGDEARRRAHQIMLDHVAQILGLPSQADPLELVRDRATARDYMLYTRRYLAASVYFTRFAVSILKVKKSEADQA